MKVWKRLASVPAGTGTAGLVVLTGLGTVAVLGGRFARHTFGFGALDQSLAMCGFACLQVVGIGRAAALLTRVRHQARRAGPGRARRARVRAVVQAAVVGVGPALAVAFSMLAVPPLVSVALLGAVAGLELLLDRWCARCRAALRLANRAGRSESGRSGRSRSGWPRPEPVRSLVPDTERELVDTGVR